MQTKEVGFLTALVAAGTLAATVAGAVTATYERIDLPTNSRFTADLNDDGTVAAYNVGGQAYRWTESGGFQVLPMGDPLSAAIGISATGDAICSSRDDSTGTRNPCLWTATSGVRDLGHPSDGCILDDSWGSGYAVSADGSVAVGLAWYCPGAQAFKWSEGAGMSGLGYPPGRSSRASDVSADGTVIVGFYESDAQGRRPARWVDDGPVDLFAGETTGGEAYSVSSNGIWIVGDVGTDAMRFSDATGIDLIRPIHPIGLESAFATGVSNDGTVVGVSSNPFAGTAEAFLWTPELGTRSLLAYALECGAVIPSDIYFTSAQAISADGAVIVGEAMDTSLAVSVFMVRLTEDPLSAPGVVTLPGPTGTGLHGAIPNPFRRDTTVSFSLTRSRPVKISIYDLRGRVVRELTRAVLLPGRHLVR